MRKLALLLGVVSAASVGHATLIYNNGAVNTINTPQPAQWGYPHIAVSVDRTVVNWDTGASYSASVQFHGNGITLANACSFNLNGGSVAITGNSGIAELVGLAPLSYTGTFTMTSGTFSLTEGYAISSGVRLLSSTTNGTFNFFGGTVNLTERGAGTLRIVRTANGDGVYSFSGTSVNATDIDVDPGVGRLLAFQATLGGSPAFYLTGGAFNLNSGEAIELFEMQAGTFNLSGGLITANQPLYGTTTGGLINLTGTFNIAPGTYNDGTWVDGAAITGTLADGSPFSLDGGLTISGNGALNIIVAPEPSVFALAGLGALALMAKRRRNIDRTTCRPPRNTA